MNYTEYQPLAHRTSSQKSHADMIINGCLGLIGESGEVVDIVKKMTYQGMPAEKAKLKMKEELGDVMWYCAELLTGLKVDMETVMDSGEAKCMMTGIGFTKMPLMAAVTRLSRSAMKPYEHYVENFPLKIEYWQKDLLDVPGILCMVKYILAAFCGCTLADCMTANIEKLKERYPVGFDEERSNNRTQEN